MVQLVAALLLVLLWCFWTSRTVDRVAKQHQTDRRQLQNEMRTIRGEMNDLRRRVVGTLEEVVRDFDALKLPDEKGEQ